MTETTCNGCEHYNASYESCMSDKVAGQIRCQVCKTQWSAADMAEQREKHVGHFNMFADLALCSGGKPSPICPGKVPKQIKKRQGDLF